MARRPSANRLSVALGDSRGAPVPTRTPSSQSAKSDGPSVVDIAFGLAMAAAGLFLVGFVALEAGDLMGDRRRISTEMDNLKSVAVATESALYADEDEAILQQCFSPPKGPAELKPALAERNRAVAQYADFLFCAMQIMPARLCEDEKRDRLIGQVGVYRKIRSELVARVKTVRVPSSGNARSSSGSSAGAGRSHYGISKQAWVRDVWPTSPSFRFDERVGYQLGYLIRNGYLERSDFSSFWSGVPDDIAVYVNNAPRESNPRC